MLEVFLVPVVGVACIVILLMLCGKKGRTAQSATNLNYLDDIPVNLGLFKSLIRFFLQIKNFLLSSLMPYIMYQLSEQYKNQTFCYELHFFLLHIQDVQVVSFFSC